MIKVSYILFNIILCLVVFSIGRTSAQTLNSVKIDLDVKNRTLNETIKIFYRGHVSYLYKKDHQKDILIDQEGYNDPIGLDWGGTIAARRSADLLPLEYKPLE